MLPLLPAIDAGLKSCTLPQFSDKADSDPALARSLFNCIITAVRRRSGERLRHLRGDFMQGCGSLITTLHLPLRAGNGNGIGAPASGMRDADRLSETG